MTKSSTKLKICGITQELQALEISNLGAHAIGVIGVPETPRFVTREKRSVIFESLTKQFPKVERVLVVANMDKNELKKEYFEEYRPTTIQLHGDETVGHCQELKKAMPEFKFWKAFRINSKKDLQKVKEYEPHVNALLLDAWSEKGLGGTGTKFQINLLKNNEIEIPWWLAGGISSEWVEDIYKYTSPYGLDASSKLERSPGIKDISKVKDLIEKVKMFTSI